MKYAHIGQGCDINTLSDNIDNYFIDNDWNILVERLKTIHKFKTGSCISGFARIGAVIYFKIMFPKQTTISVHCTRSKWVPEPNIGSSK